MTRKTLQNRHVPGKVMGYCNASASWAVFKKHLSYDLMQVNEDRDKSPRFQWASSACGATHNFDVNAAQNILAVEHGCLTVGITVS